MRIFASYFVGLRIGGRGVIWLATCQPCSSFGDREGTWFARRGCPYSILLQETWNLFRQISFPCKHNLRDETGFYLSLANNSSPIHPSTSAFQTPILKNLRRIELTSEFSHSAVGREESRTSKFLGTTNNRHQYPHLYLAHVVSAVSLAQNAVDSTAQWVKLEAQVQMSKAIFFGDSVVMDHGISFSDWDHCRFDFEVPFHFNHHTINVTRPACKIKRENRQVVLSLLICKFKIAYYYIPNGQ